MDEENDREIFQPLGGINVELVLLRIGIRAFVVRDVIYDDNFLLSKHVKCRLRGNNRWNCDGKNHG